MISVFNFFLSNNKSIDYSNRIKICLPSFIKQKFMFLMCFKVRASSTYIFNQINICNKKIVLGRKFNLKNVIYH